MGNDEGKRPQSARVKSSNIGQNRTIRFYNFIKEEPGRLQCFCFICYKSIDDIDFEDSNAENKYKEKIENNKKDYQMKYEDMKSELINLFAYNNFSTVEKFLETNVAYCTHYNHYECSKKYEESNNVERMPCYFCKNYITFVNMYHFKKLEKDDCLKILNFYKNNEKCPPTIQYKSDMIKIISQLIDNTPEISYEDRERARSREKERQEEERKKIEELKEKERKEKEKEKRRKEEERREKQRERERERESRRNDYDDNDNYHSSNYSSYNKKSSPVKTVKKEEKVMTLCCNDCSGHCFFCRSKCPKSGKIYAHKSCYRDRQCIVCQSKRGYNSIVATCNRCRSGSSSKYSKIANVCVICRKPF